MAFTDKELSNIRENCPIIKSYINEEWYKIVVELIEEIQMLRKKEDI